MVVVVVYGAEPPASPASPSFYLVHRSAGGPSYASWSRNLTVTVTVTMTVGGGGGGMTGGVPLLVLLVSMRMLRRLP